MYSVDVPVPVIAAWCRVAVKRVIRAVDRQITRDPAQNDSHEARVLYRWVENQRRNHDDGTLTPARIEALNALEEWIGTRRGNADVLWDRRLNEVRQFRDEVGRFPDLRPRPAPGRDCPRGMAGSATHLAVQGGCASTDSCGSRGILPGWNAARSESERTRLVDSGYSSPG
ncbi:helicase associated domain-containing protein [Arthrobacter sp. Ld5]|uniref:helicase associated domain-containing protein n=1 Tax=Arthrobacter sp. Ld5 TaxID=649152 RepID=UPI003EBF30BE